MIDLAPEYLEKVRAILRQHVPQCEVRAFGSRVGWTAKDYSDLDLAVMGSCTLKTGFLGRLKEAFEESDLPFRVDVLDWHATSPEFQKVIEKQYEVVLGAKSESLADEWKPFRLGDLVEVRHGWPFQSEFFSEERTGGPVVVGIGNFRYSGGFRFESTTLKEYRGKYPKEFELDPGDILLVMTCQTAGGEILGIPGRIPNDGQVYLHNQRMGKVVIKGAAKVRADFLYWLFLSKAFNRHLVDTATGTKILHTAPSRIEDFSFKLPPQNEQKAIAHILGTLDDKIELNRRMNETLEEMARALFKSWFVDFDPVRAKAEGRNPGLPKHLADLFPDSFEESELGEIPRGWRAGLLGEIAENPRRGIQPSAVNPSTPYIGLEHMPRQSIALSEWGEAGSVESNKSEFKRGEILFGKLRPYFHKVGVAPTAGVCSTDIVVTRSKDEGWFGFVLEHMASVRFVEYTNAGSTGTKMPRTNWDQMSRYPIVRPTDEVALRFNQLTGPLVQRIVAGIYQSRSLAALRDTLLPKLISGELRIKDAERIAPEVT